jgi:uncharacterized protein YkwD
MSAAGGTTKETVSPMKKVAAAAAAVLAAGGLAVSVARAGVDGSAAPAPEWLSTINAYRASAGVSPVSEDETWSAQAAQHARYQVANGTAGGEEDPAAPFATQGGAAVAANAEVAVASHGELSERAAVDRWMSSPLHALGLLRPRLDRVGYGSWQDSAATRGVQSSAVLDVVRGLGPGSSSGQSPLVRWPGPGSTVPLTRYTGDDQPDLLRTCGADYVTPTGVPILVLFPTPTPVTQAAIEVDGTASESCVVDEGSFEGPGRGDLPGAEVARALLGGDNAVVVLPRQPLPAGVAVHVSLQTGSGTLAWSFRTTDPGGSVLPAEGTD